MKELQKVFEAKMTVPEIIIYCKNDLGILFERISETEASEFLQKNNFFLRIIQYAEVWEKTTANGKYENMDFAHLIELSTIDMFFRKLIFKMAIDFEHYLKVALVNECQHNIADDGYELTMFRNFRDNWLRFQPDGENLIRQYYKTAPSIVTNINSKPNKNKIYRTIYEKYLLPCLSYIEKGENEKCKEHYTVMIHILEKSINTF